MHDDHENKQTDEEKKLHQELEEALKDLYELIDLRESMSGGTVTIGKKPLGNFADHPEIHEAHRTPKKNEKNEEEES
ncbi:hypothetical protein [Marinithermus hydrothermalis]|uniref:Uncharacterized protein n=1 Tax=Marinithermus hydrothermalis (strain DSM 14884 / JCM 11576 / T1) TaxID=869210 RepID=F2NNB0_MARHT|nr:hypothetical protein [Marinithermus hydrothermalis]AEB10951.1 hypothetical protein Marky_0190 [Marinithermus hydrothermalis DSM 14884]